MVFWCGSPVRICNLCSAGCAGLFVIIYFAQDAGKKISLADVAPG